MWPWPSWDPQPPEPLPSLLAASLCSQKSYGSPCRAPCVWFFRSRCPSASSRIELCQPLLSCWKRHLQVISVKCPQGQALAKALWLRDRIQRILSSGFSPRLPVSHTLSPPTPRPNNTPPPPGPLPVDS